MKHVLITLCLVFGLLMASPVSNAQDLDRIGFTGAGYFDGAQMKGVAGFIKQIGEDSKIYNVTETTIGMVPSGTGNISFGMKKDLQADFSTGVLYNAATVKGVTIFGLMDGGLQQTGEDSSAMFKAGGGLHKFLYKDKIGLAIFGTWKYAEDPVAQNMQWKVNPAVALTFRF